MPERLGTILVMIRRERLWRHTEVPFELPTEVGVGQKPQLSCSCLVGVTLLDEVLGKVALQGPEPFRWGSAELLFENSL